jgi:hypothetical protein
VKGFEKMLEKIENHAVEVLKQERCNREYSRKKKHL